MSRIFVYSRVSTIEQESLNQLDEIKAAGFNVEPHRVVIEIVSGSMTMTRRSRFSSLLDKMKQGDTLIVATLDSLGRDATDVGITVAKLKQEGIRVYCLALGCVNLTSSAGRLTMSVIDAVAQLERNLLIEKTQSGLVQTKTGEKILSRPPTLSHDQQKIIRQRLAGGESASVIARDMKTSRQIIMLLDMFRSRSR